jgi:hypothetical protein
MSNVIHRTVAQGDMPVREYSLGTFCMLGTFVLN